ncbi:outer membrane beta-barrel protein [Desulfococcaceae bacterium HSG9]|nr:outer membrane beta-barrel protein [Desulfococcaceae bacterium HSG9]
MLKKMSFTLLMVFILLTPISINAKILLSSVSVNDGKTEETTAISGDIFEKGGGYIHPLIIVEGGYTDNVFNTNEDKTGDYHITVSPEIWLAFPGSEKRWANLFTSSKTPAGHIFTRSNPSTLRQFQAYLSGRANITRYHENTDQNTDTYDIQGRFLYNAKGGLSLDLIDDYKLTFDSISTGAATLKDEGKYRSNLFDAILTYDVTEKTKLRLGYSNFDLDYDNSTLTSNNRNDNAYSGYVYYTISPKTSFFVNLDFIDIRYEQDGFSDSTELDAYGGIDWRATSKTAGYFKSGYGVKNFSDDSDKAENLILEGSVSYIFSPKVTFGLRASQRMDESQIDGMNYTLTRDLQGTYQHQITDAMKFNLMLGYANSDFYGRMIYNNVTYERDDELYRISPSLNYQIMDWLAAILAYDFSMRDSNIPDFNFKTNTSSLRISASL